MRACIVLFLLLLASTAYGGATVNVQGNDNTFTGANMFTQPIVGSVTGSALTAGTASYAATAGVAGELSANGSNCSAGSYPLGVDATGAVESCTALPTLAYGTYTPSVSTVSNASAATPLKAQYLRVGNTVTVSGYVTVTITTTGAATQVAVSLPVPSNFTSGVDCVGVLAAYLSQQAGTVIADVSGDRALLYWKSTDTGTVSFGFHFTYEVK